MNIHEYQKLASRTRPDLGDDFNNQLHMVMGISTEAGELLDVYKKRLAYNKELDLINIGEELGDISWYWIELCELLGFDPEVLFTINIEKLKERFPDKFSEDKAINRDTDRERQILMELGF